MCEACVSLEIFLSEFSKSSTFVALFPQILPSCITNPKKILSLVTTSVCGSDLQYTTVESIMCYILET